MYFCRNTLTGCMPFFNEKYLILVNLIEGGSEVMGLAKLGLNASQKDKYFLRDIPEKETRNIRTLGLLCLKIS